MEEHEGSMIAEVIRKLIEDYQSDEKAVSILSVILT